MEIDAAKKVINSIFETLSIKKIYYIDDLFEKREDVELIIGWFSTAKDLQPETVHELMPDVPFDGPYENILRDQWKGFSSEKKEQLATRLSNICDNEYAVDFSSMTKLNAKSAPIRTVIPGLSAQ